MNTEFRADLAKLPGQRLDLQGAFAGKLGLVVTLLGALQQFSLLGVEGLLQFVPLAL